MKIKLLFSLTILIAGGGCLWAQDADVYFPSVVMTEYADELSETTDANTSDFSPLSGDYTIEVTGTSGTEIKFPYDRYRTVSYTPTASGTIRFVHKDGNEKVFVYEKASTTFVYKGKAAISSVTWPAMETANVNDPTNLLDNPDFQDYGDLISSGKYKLGTPWEISDASLYGGFRQGKNSNSHDNSGTTTDCFIWRTDDSKTGYKGKYFYQEVTLSPNSQYKYRIRTSQNTNGKGKYSIRLGSTPGGNEYSSIDFTINKDATNNVATGNLTTGATIGEHSYFSVYNAYDYNNTNNNACTQIDLIQLVEATTAATTITGVSDAKYKAAAVSPFCEGNMTAKINNPFIESGTSGWTGGRTNNGQQYTGAPGGTYMDTYNDTRDQYQSVASLPAGIYTIKAATRAEASLGVGYIYAQSGDIKIATTEVHKDGNTGGALGNGWSWTETTFVIAAEGAVRIGFYAECGGGKWAGADEFYLTYKGTDLPSAWCTTLLSEVVDGKMNATVASTQTTEASNLESSETLANYCALRDAIIAAKESKAAYISANEKLTAMKAVVDATNVYTADALNAYYTTPKSNYDDNSLTTNEANALQDPTATTGVKAAITVDNFLLSAWNTEPDFTAEDSPYYINSWSTEGKTDGSGMTTPFFEYWVSNSSTAKLGERTLTATINELPAGNYYVDVLVRVCKNTGDNPTPYGITLDVNGGTPVDVCAGNKIGSTTYYYDTFRALGTVADDGVLTINFNVAEDNNISWLAFKNVTYAVFNGATEEQKEALATAITTAEGKTLGFVKDEYAPYNNVDALEYLAIAKDIDPETATSSEVTTATSNLSGATWTANASDVDAIYNGTFAVVNGTNPKGWSRSNNGWGQQITGLTKETNKVNEGTTTAWYYNNNGAWQYGNEGVYTMPLAASTLYKLTFKYSKHNSDGQSWMKASVLKETEGLEAVQYVAASSSTEYKTVVAYFTTGAAGDYVLSIENSGNAHMTDVSLVKADASELTISSGNVTNDTFFETLTIGERTFSNEKWNTLCVPFAFPKSTFAEVKVLDDITVTDDHVSMAFADAGETVAAGTPCLVKASAADYSLVLENVNVKAATTAGSTEKVDGTKVTYQGVFTNTSLDDGDNAWIVKDNLLHKVVNAGTVGAYRAYFTVEAPAPVKALSFSFDDMPTAINAVEATQNENAVIYNLAGQRLNKAQKGVNIINGKKVLVK